LDVKCRWSRGVFACTLSRSFELEMSCTAPVFVTRDAHSQRSPATMQNAPDNLAHLQLTDAVC